MLTDTTELRAKIAARALETLSYDPGTGLLTWKKPRRLEYVGRKAGYVDKYGYVRVSLCRLNTAGHRIAWLLLTGSWPANEIDHINGNRSDNRACNLRNVTRRVNRENMREAMPGSKSGLLGVRWHARDNLWVAVIQVRGIKKTLGYRKNKHEAHELYLAAKRRLHDGCTI